MVRELEPARQSVSLTKHTSPSSPSTIHHHLQKTSAAAAAADEHPSEIRLCARCHDTLTTHNDWCPPPPPPLLEAPVVRERETHSDTRSMTPIEHLESHKNGAIQVMGERVWPVCRQQQQVVESSGEQRRQQQPKGHGYD